MNPILELKNISYSYHTPEGETQALSDITFSLSPGEFTAVVGPSGCGKSTLLSLIAGLMRAESGEILLNGTPLTENSSRIGYMLQHDYLFEWRTVYRNIILGAEINGTLDEKTKEKAAELLEQYGLAQFARSKPSELSGGMRQRAALIRTLLLDPELLLLDEPARLQEKAEEVEEEYLGSMESRTEAGMEDEDDLRVFPVKEIIEKMNHYCGFGFTTLESRCGAFHVRETYSIQTKGVNPYNSSFELLTRDLKRLKRNGWRVILLSGSRTRAKRLAEDLRDYDLSSFYSEDMERRVNPGEIMVAYGYVAEGYEYPMLKFTVISESDIFGKKKKKKRDTLYSCCPDGSDPEICRSGCQEAETE